MIKKIIYLIGVFIVVSYIWIMIPKPMTLPGHFDKIYKEREEKFNNILTYTSECNVRAIQSVAVHYYEDKQDIKRCEEWIKKRNKCISLHPEYKEKVFKKISEICVKREEK